MKLQLGKIIPCGHNGAVTLERQASADYMKSLSRLANKGQVNSIPDIRTSHLDLEYILNVMEKSQ